MAYDVAGIRSKVLVKLDDTNFSTAAVNQFINDANREIVNTYRWPFMEDTFTGTLTVGDNTYDYPTNAQKILSLRITGPDSNEYDLTYHYIPYAKFDRMYPDIADDSTGLPASWTLYADNFIFSSRVDKAYVLVSRFLKEPTSLTSDSDVPDLPESFEELLVTGAYMRALERNDDNDIADYQRSRYYEPQLQNMLLRYYPRTINSQNVMRNSRWGI